MKEVYYDDIPLGYIGKNILEIGVHPRILNSKIWPKIKKGNYTGIDVIIPEDSNLNFIKADITEYKLKNKYDTIIMIEVMEHIHLKHWRGVFNKLKGALVDGGYLIISTPHKQKLQDYINSIPPDAFQVHTIFGINKKIMNLFFPGCQMKKITTILWRQDSCSLLWAVGRFFNRLFFGISPVKRNIIVFWQKNI